MNFVNRHEPNSMCSKNDQSGTSLTGSLHHKLSETMTAALDEAQIVWLFICNDIKSMIIPTMTFAATSALIEPLSGASAPKGIHYLTSFLAAGFWSCINLFLFCVHNQRQPAAIEEDRQNKAWRPLPSSRITQDQVTPMLVIGYSISLAFSYHFGGLKESVVLGILTLSYNEWGGGNTCLIRNLLNAGGVVFYYLGALDVFMTSGGKEFAVRNTNLDRWLAVIGGVIFTTIHLQDLRDKEGDAKRERRTIPLVYGDVACRVSVVFALGLWSFLVPFLWHASLVGYVIPMSLGLWLMRRVMVVRTAEGDDQSFKLWSFWMVALLLTPLAKYSGLIA